MEIDYIHAYKFCFTLIICQQLKLGKGVKFQGYI